LDEPIVNNTNRRSTVVLALILVAMHAAGAGYHLDCLAASDSATSLSPEAV
jgi:hypothetical protein